MTQLRLYMVYAIIVDLTKWLDGEIGKRTALRLQVLRVQIPLWLQYIGGLPKGKKGTVC